MNILAFRKKMDFSGLLKKNLSGISHKKCIFQEFRNKCILRAFLGKKKQKQKKRIFLELRYNFKKGYLHISK